MKMARTKGYSTAQVLRGEAGTEMLMVVSEAIASGRISCNREARREFNKLLVLREKAMRSQPTPKPKAAVDSAADKQRLRAELFKRLRG
jgi:hypothetical protein